MSSTTNSSLRSRKWVSHLRGEIPGSTAPIYRSTRGQLPMLNVAHNVRNNFVAVVGEFVGTFLFLFFAFAGGQLSNTPKPAEGAPPNTSNLLYLSLTFGFSLMINVWTFYRVTGGLFNPVVSTQFLSFLYGIIGNILIAAHFEGDFGTLSVWRYASATWYPGICSSGNRRDCISWCGQLFIPRSPECWDSFRWWHLNLTRFIY